jgi:hypothetical protein
LANIDIGEGNGSLFADMPQQGHFDTCEQPVNKDVTLTDGRCDEMPFDVPLKRDILPMNIARVKMDNCFFACARFAQV